MVFVDLLTGAHLQLPLPAICALREIKLALPIPPDRGVGLAMALVVVATLDVQPMWPLPQQVAETTFVREQRLVRQRGHV